MQIEKESILMTPERIIREIVQWDDPDKMRENLKEMFIAFYYLHDCPGEEWKSEIAGTYQTLDKALKQMSPFKLIEKN
jgi:hypothetical protein